MSIGKQSIITSAILSLLLSSLLSFGTRADSVSIGVGAPPQNDPAAALTRGRTLLRQGRADQALGYLEAALNLYTQTNNSRGMAATEDGFGDLYLIQGQYKVALDHYQKAYQAFVTGRGQDEKSQAAAGKGGERGGQKNTQPPD